MDIKQLHTLVSIADGGSFNAAAARMHCTPSAVSMQMKALEAELGAELFDRSVRPPTFTRAGRGALYRAREILSMEARLRAEVADGESLRGNVRLGAVPSATTGILPGVLASVRRDHAQLQLRVETGLSSDLSLRVSQGELDAAVITQSAPPESNLVSYTVLEEPLALVLPAAAEIDAGADDAAILGALPFIRFNRLTGIGQIIDRALAARGIAVNESMELDSIEAILLMVANGLGAAVVPAGSVTEALRFSLRVAPFGSPPLERRVALIVRRSNADAAFVRVLRAALAAHAHTSSLPRVQELTVPARELEEGHEGG